MIVSTVVIFFAMYKLHQRFTYPFLLPILTTTIIMVGGILLLNIPYADYMKGGQWIQHLLGPAVVALAYPLYNQREMILKYKYTILSGIVIAMISGLLSVFVILKLFKLDEQLILTALPKSITTPVAMQVSESIGGIPPLTAVLVMIAGFVGALFGSVIYKFGKIDSTD